MQPQFVSRMVADKAGGPSLVDKEAIGSLSF
jgi:hypothetical protein